MALAKAVVTGSVFRAPEKGLHRTMFLFLHLYLI